MRPGISASRSGLSSLRPSTMRSGKRWPSAIGGSSRFLRQQLEDRARYFSNRCRPAGGFGRPFREHGEDVRLAIGRIHDPGIVRDRRDLAGFMGDADRARQTRGNAPLELLRMEYIEHLVRELRRECALLGDQPKKLHESVSGHAIDDAMLEGALILDSARDIDPIHM